MSVSGTAEEGSTGRLIVGVGGPVTAHGRCVVVVVHAPATDPG